MPLTHKVSLDVSRPKSTKPIYTKVNNVGDTILATITDGGEKINYQDYSGYVLKNVQKQTMVSGSVIDSNAVLFTVNTPGSSPFFDRGWNLLVIQISSSNGDVIETQNFQAFVDAASEFDIDVSSEITKYTITEEGWQNLKAVAADISHYRNNIDMVSFKDGSGEYTGDISDGELRIETEAEENVIDTIIFNGVENPMLDGKTVVLNSPIKLIKINGQTSVASDGVVSIDGKDVIYGKIKYAEGYGGVSIGSDGSVVLTPVVKDIRQNDSSVIEGGVANIEADKNIIEAIRFDGTNVSVSGKTAVINSKNSFGRIIAGGTTVNSNTYNDALTITGSNGVVVTPNVSNRKIDISYDFSAASIEADDITPALTRNLVVGTAYVYTDLNDHKWVLKTDGDGRYYYVDNGTKIYVTNLDAATLVSGWFQITDLGYADSGDVTYVFPIETFSDVTSVAEEDADYYLPVADLSSEATDYKKIKSTDLINDIANEYRKNHRTEYIEMVLDSDEWNGIDVGEALVEIFTDKVSAAELDEGDFDVHVRVRADSSAEYACWGIYCSNMTYQSVGNMCKLSFKFNRVDTDGYPEDIHLIAEVRIG